MINSVLTPHIHTQIINIHIAVTRHCNKDSSVISLLIHTFIQQQNRSTYYHSIMVNIDIAILTALTILTTICRPIRVVTHINKRVCSLIISNCRRKNSVTYACYRIEKKCITMGLKFLMYI